MKKLAVICLCTLVMGMVPIYAVDSKNTTTDTSNSSLNPIKQIQNSEQKLPQDVQDKINTLKNQIKDLRAKIHQNREEMVDLLKQNKELRKNIKENKTDNNAIQQINQTKKEIIDLRNQNKDLREQVNALHSQLLELVK